VKPTPLARFAVVGTAVTAVDVGLFVLRLRGGRRSVLDAEVPALVASAGVSWALHRAVTFRNDPYRRWLSEHDAFTASAVVAGAVDVAVTSALLTVGGRRDTRAAMAAKLPAVAVAGATRWALHRRVLFRVVRAAHVPAADRDAAPGRARVSVVVPAFNEATRIGEAVRRIKEAVPDAEIVVVDDGSTDATARIAEAAGARVLRLPFNLGIGGAVQAGFRYALDNGYDYVVQVDGDGQHDPGDLVALIDSLERTRADAAVGSRWVSPSGYRASGMRRLLQRVVAACISSVVRAKVTDPTSGFWVFGPRALALLGNVHPTGYPEPELHLLLWRNGLKVVEAPVTMRVRAGGRSSLTLGRALVAVLRALLAVVVAPRRALEDGRR
jgi:hypothetical protein